MEKDINKESKKQIFIYENDELKADIANTLKWKNVSNLNSKESELFDDTYRIFNEMLDIITTVRKNLKKADEMWLIIKGNKEFDLKKFYKDYHTNQAIDLKDFYTKLYRYHRTLVKAIDQYEKFSWKDNNEQ